MGTAPDKPVIANTVRLRVTTTKVVTGDHYIYHTEYVPEPVEDNALLHGWIGDVDVPIPNPNPHETILFEDGDLGKKTKKTSYIDGELIDGRFATKGDDAERYSLNDGELTHNA
jgi:hypothetical protein